MSVTDGFLKSMERYAMCDFKYDPKTHKMIAVPFDDDADCADDWVAQQRLEFWAHRGKEDARRRAAGIDPSDRSTSPLPYVTFIIGGGLGWVLHSLWTTV